MGNDVNVNIRKAELKESSEILRLVQDAIVANAGDHYSAEQIRAWVSGFSEESIILAIQHTKAFVAEMEGAVVGFGNVELSDLATARIHLLYVSSQNQRRGVGASLIQELERQAMRAGKTSIEADASLQAYKLFLTVGYSAREQYLKKYNEIEFQNSWMERTI